MYLSAKQKRAVAGAEGLSRGIVRLPASTALVIPKCLRGVETVLLESRGCCGGEGEAGSGGLMKVMGDDPCLLPSASVVGCGMVCVYNTVSSLEWEPRAWQLSVWVGFAIGSGICLFSRPVSVPIYTKKMKVKPLPDERTVFVFLP